VNEFRFSFFCFFALVMLLPWVLGFVLWRRFGRREKALHITIASTGALAFGATWWTVIHPAIWPNPAPGPANPNPPPLSGLIILAGVAGIISLTLATVVLIVIIAVWDRARPGTFARLTAGLKPQDPPAQ
jgi:hypothetical protein